MDDEKIVRKNYMVLYGELINLTFLKKEILIMAKNVEVVEEVVVDDQLTTAEGASVEVIEKESFGKKTLKFAKKNWKKAVVGAIGIGGVIGGYCLGKKSNASTGIELIDVDDASIGDDVEVADTLSGMSNDGDNE